MRGFILTVHGIHSGSNFDVFVFRNWKEPKGGMEPVFVSGLSEGMRA